jgi:hypothetical protein
MLARSVIAAIATAAISALREPWTPEAVGASRTAGDYRRFRNGNGSMLRERKASEI